MKTELLEGGVRVPCLIRWPAGIPGGRVSDQVAITMDWMPTLLAAAGMAPDPGMPTDGMDLLGSLSGREKATPRLLFWRYRHNQQRACREGDYKFLKIRENTFLFDVVADPRERANLKDRLPEVYARLTAQWEAWNATMLPEDPDSFAEGYSAKVLADRIGLA